MTDSEINEAVAIKLGWELINELVDIDGFVCDQTWKRGEDIRRHAKGKVFRYTEEIEKAWEIMEHLHPTNCVDVFSRPAHYVAKIIGNREVDIYMALAETAPMAICVAFLKMP